MQRNVDSKEVNTISNQQQRRPKRPVDKQLFTMVNLNQGTTRKASSIRTSVVAETFTSMKMTIGIIKGSEALDTVLALCIVKQPEGSTLGTISFVDGEQIYQIDGDLLYGRYFQLPTGANAIWAENVEISVNAQRKMKVGDQLVIILQAITNNAAGYTVHTASFFKQ